MVELNIHPTRTALRRAMKRIGKNPKGLEGIVIPVEQYNFKGGKKTKTPLAVEIHIHKNMCIPVVMHEILHVATVLCRKQKIKLNLGTRIGVTEELLAYYHTWVTQEVLKHFIPKINSDYNFSSDNIKKWARASTRQHK